jgi:hypothetical protein
MAKLFRVSAAVLAAAVGLGSGGTAIRARAANDLPIDHRRLLARPEVKFYHVRNLISIRQIQAAVRDGDQRGLTLDFSGLTTLLDGTRIDPRRIYGRIYVGPYPFAARERADDHKRLRLTARINNGRGIIPCPGLLDKKINGEGWGNHGTVLLRLELFLARPGPDRSLGRYDTFVSFRVRGPRTIKTTSVIEGPSINLVRSDDPTKIVIAFTTDRPVIGRVVVPGVGRFVSPGAATRHEITVTGLRPGRVYRYFVRAGETRTRTSWFKSAPPPGRGPVTVAFIGDSREGEGGGMRQFMGVNADTLGRVVNVARRKGATVLLMGGDLINGYTSVPDDFQTQLHAFKQAVAGFVRHFPVYPLMGNHEALLRVFKDPTLSGIWKKWGAQVDAWPYATRSSEAAFAAAFVNPTNGPRPSDPRRPSYRENVYALQYGPLLILGLNNNYWVSYAVRQYGGAPEGWMFDDQLDWIERRLEAARRDPTIKYVILYMQEPVFPNDGHLQDAMWYHGNNNVRAYVFRGGRLRPEKKGIIQVRNRLARLAARFAKVAAVLASDEHVFHRTLIHRRVPIGDPARDDANGNGRLGEPGETVSPLPDLKYPVHYLVSGGAGAPYYAEAPTPWNRYWKGRRDGRRWYRYSMQSNVIILRAGARRISMEVFNPYGELIDRIDDLMAVKRARF